jgi:transposase-like protein
MITFALAWSTSPVRGEANEAGLELRAAFFWVFPPMTDHETDAPAAMFHDEAKAREYFEALRWPAGNPICPRCGSVNVHRLKGRVRRRGQIICNTCLETFSVTVGTVMERSRVPLNKWARAFHMMAEKGISAKQLQRELQLGSYRTARFMRSRIRQGMKLASFMGRPIDGSGKADVAGHASRPGARHPSNGSRMPVSKR